MTKERKFRLWSKASDVLGDICTISAALMAILGFAMVFILLYVKARFGTLTGESIGSLNNVTTVMFYALLVLFGTSILTMVGFFVCGLISHKYKDDLLILTSH